MSLASLNSNVILLILKSELGKVRSRCYTLPGEEFTYGVKNTPLDGGVAEGTAWRACNLSHNVHINQCRQCNIMYSIVH